MIQYTALGKDVLQFAFIKHISHCVALDEAHEMGINKGTKQLVARPTEENMHRLSSVMHACSKMQEVVKQLVGIGNSECGESHHLPDKVSTKGQHTLVKTEHNILESLRQSGMFQYVEENRGLVSLFSRHKS